MAESLLRHTHLTRDIRPEGECPGCDEHHAKVAEAEKVDRKATDEIRASERKRK